MNDPYENNLESDPDIPHDSSSDVEDVKSEESIDAMNTGSLSFEEFFPEDQNYAEIKDGKKNNLPAELWISYSLPEEEYEDLKSVSIGNGVKPLVHMPLPTVANYKELRF